MDWEDDTDFILGYLSQCKRLGGFPEPERLLDIVIFLIEEIKKIKQQTTGA